MAESNKPTILCIASFFKGNEFIRECRRQGARVVLLTRQKLLDAEWARESLDDLIAIPGTASLQSYLAAASDVARHSRITRVIALEEYDIVTAAQIREHLCVPGLGTTTARCFQDKLAMRTKASQADILQPEFVSALNYQGVEEFMTRTAGPWMLKPRIGSSAMGIRRLAKPEEVWRSLAELDQHVQFEENSSSYLLEHFIPGDVYHVDSLIDRGKVLFASVERYGAPPFEISHFGGVNLSHTVKHGSRAESILFALNEKLLSAFGLERGVTHAEFIRGTNARENNQFYFLEIAARVGGAYTSNTIAAASGLNFWREWARIELASPERPYHLPPVRREYGGIAVSLARQQHPSTFHYRDPEIVYRISQPWHAGLIVRSPDYGRVVDLLSRYALRFNDDFTAVAPPEETPLQHL